MQISAAMVKELRERTGAGMMECKQALVDENGDIETAVGNLRKKGQAKADKKAGRIAAEGVIGLALATDAGSGALVEVNSETDFAAKQEEFQEFANSVAQRVLDERPADLGALLSAPLRQGESESIEERVRDMVMRIGEKISVRRFQVMESAGGAVRAVLEAVGVKDILTKCLRTNNPHNVVKATINGLLTLRNAEQYSKAREKTVEAKSST